MSKYVLFSFFFLLFALPVQAAGEHAKWPGAFPCSDAQIVENINGDINMQTYTAPPGGIVTGVCVYGIGGGNIHTEKRGNEAFALKAKVVGGPQTPCFQISGVGTSTVTVTRDAGFSQTSCAYLSHLDIYGTGLAKVAAATPTPTLTPTFTPTPIASPTPTPISTPSAVNKTTNAPTSVGNIIKTIQLWFVSLFATWFRK